MSLFYVSEHSKDFLRNWERGEDPPTLLGQIPKFDCFEGFPYRSTLKYHLYLTIRLTHKRAYLTSSKMKKGL